MTESNIQNKTTKNPMDERCFGALNALTWAFAGGVMGAERAAEKAKTAYEPPHVFKSPRVGLGGRALGSTVGAFLGYAFAQLTVAKCNTHVEQAHWPLKRAFNKQNP